MKPEEENLAGLMIQGASLLLLAGLIGAVVFGGVFFGGIGAAAWLFKEFYLGLLSFFESSGAPHGATDGGLLLKVCLLGLALWAIVALIAHFSKASKK